MGARLTNHRGGVTISHRQHAEDHVVEQFNQYSA
jgi:hypothetical protein